MGDKFDESIEGIDLEKKDEIEIKTTIRSKGRVSKKTAIVVSIMIIFSAIVLLEYAAIRSMTIEITNAIVVEESNLNAIYAITLQVNNHGIMPIAVGDTEYSIVINGESLGKGNIKAVILEPFASKTLNTEFRGNMDTIEKYNNNIVEQDHSLNGISKYELSIFSVNIPFEYKPSNDEIKMILRM